MPLLSLFSAGGRDGIWSVRRAAVLGATLGAAAALIRSLGPMHEAGPASVRLVEIAVAAAGLAVLCAGAAALRNALRRRLQP